MYIMKKLIEQILKFGVVGVICFLIDFVISTTSFHILNSIMTSAAATLISGFLGFVISAVINYILSMKFVFARKEDMNRGKEFVIFMVLSVIGLGINEVILLIFSAIRGRSQFLTAICSATLWFAGSKIFATAVVMVYNFVTRKIFLEKKD